MAEVRPNLAELTAQFSKSYAAHLAKLPKSPYPPAPLPTPPVNPEPSDPTLGLDWRFWTGLALGAVGLVLLLTERRG